MSDCLIRHVSEGRNHGKLSLILQNVSRFYDVVYIDEFQDFRKKDYELLMLFPKFFPEVIMVGDYYQHSVAGKNNEGIPFEKGRKKVPVGYVDFIKNLKDMGIEVDCVTLQKSRRCSEAVCAFIRKRLGIQIKGDEHEGAIFTLIPGSDKNFVPVEILKDDRIPKLVYRDAAKQQKIKAINWSYAKGDTFEDICVILTENTEAVIKGPLPEDISPSTRNKLYVAITRAKRNVYLLRKSEYEEALEKIK